MHSVTAHAAWWDRELRLLWPQAAMVIGDHASHRIATALTGAGGILTGAGFPSTLRDRASNHLDRDPDVERNGSRLHVEVPDGASLVGPFHHVDVPISVWGWAPATVIANVGLDADPTDREPGLNVFLDGEVRVDLPDFVKWATGLIALEHGLDWGPLTVILESIVFGLSDFDLLDLDLFSALLYNRRELTPSSPTPDLLSGAYGAEPVDSDRVDWWDIVFISDGFGRTNRAIYDNIVSLAVAQLTPPPGMPVADVGAAVWNAFSGAIRIWSLPLIHTGSRLSTDDGRRSAIRDLAAVAEAGLIFEDHLGAEYPDSPPIPGRTTWVIVRRGEARAMTFGNFVLLPVEASDTATSRMEVLIHELGHLRLAALGDEYLRGDDGVYVGPEPRQPNLSTSATPAKWSALAPLIGPTEGAYERYPRGVFRPTSTCRMDASGNPTVDFCPVCKDAISNGVLAHLTSGSGPLRPPLTVRVRFAWPFVGERSVFGGAGIGAGGHVPRGIVPYFEHDGLRVNTQLGLDVLQASVPRPITGLRRAVVARPRELIRVEVSGTHPNVGFPSGVLATQAMELDVSDRLTLEDFDFQPPFELSQSSAGVEIPIGGEVRAEIDDRTGELRTDVMLSARSGLGIRDDVRLVTATVIAVAPLGAGPEERLVTFADGLGTPHLGHSRSFRDLELGEYRWRAETRLAPETLPDPADYRPTRYVLGRSELERGRSDHHFAIRRPEPVDAPPVRPVAIAAGRVRVTVAVDREGRVIDSPEGRRESSFGVGTVSLRPEEVGSILGGRPVWRGPGPFGPGFAPGAWPVPRGGLPFGPSQGGPSLPEPGELDRWIGREPPRELIITRRIVMIAWSWSPAADSIRLEFQISRNGGGYVDVPPDRIAILQRGSWADPDAPLRSVRVTYWDYADDEGASDDDRWRCRAVDRTGRRSPWSRSEPLLGFNTALIPARLGSPI